jgi:hypothetical protein
VEATYLEHRNSRRTYIPARHEGGSGRLSTVGRHDCARSSLERFIAERYAGVYGAHIDHFAEHLVGLRDAARGWSAAVGYTLAGASPLFLEQYLDQPIEAAIEQALGEALARNQIVEVGNLAACTPGAARRVIRSMTALLHRMERTWVVFTSTRSLLNSFARLGIEPIVLAPANPARLPDGGRSWGTYYETEPHVMTANIPLGLIHLGLTEHDGVAC